MFFTHAHQRLRMVLRSVPSGRSMPRMRSIRSISDTTYAVSLALRQFDTNALPREVSDGRKKKNPEVWPDFCRRQWHSAKNLQLIQKVHTWTLNFFRIENRSSSLAGSMAGRNVFLLTGGLGPEIPNRDMGEISIEVVNCCSTRYTKYSYAQHRSFESLDILCDPVNDRLRRSRSYWSKTSIDRSHVIMQKNLHNF